MPFIKSVNTMRRSVKQDRLLALCTKMSEVIMGLSDDECDACFSVFEAMYTAATAPLLPSLDGVWVQEVNKVPCDNEEEKKSPVQEDAFIVCPTPCTPAKPRSSLKRSLVTDYEADDELGDSSTSRRRVNGRRSRAK
jgi:hypothetical protein